MKKIKLSLFSLSVKSIVFAFLITATSCNDNSEIDILDKGYQIKRIDEPKIISTLKQSYSLLNENKSSMDPHPTFQYVDMVENKEYYLSRIFEENKFEGSDLESYILYTETHINNYRVSLGFILRMYKLEGEV